MDTERSAVVEIAALKLDTLSGNCSSKGQASTQPLSYVCVCVEAQSSGS